MSLRPSTSARPDNQTSSVIRERENLAQGSYFDPSIVVSRNALGKAISVYGDDSWDFKSFSIDGTSALAVHFWRAPKTSKNIELENRIREQNKALIWILLDRGDLKSISTLKSCNFGARFCSKMAYENGVDLFNWITDLQKVSGACETMGINGLRMMSVLVQTLWRNRKELLEKDFQFPREQIISKIRTAQSKLPDQKQTPIIPSSIYCSILKGLLLALDAIEKDIDLLLDSFVLSTKCSKELKEIRPSLSKNQIKDARSKLLSQTAQELKRLGWEEANGRSLHLFIVGKISLVQTHLMHVVVALSGMRIGEVKALPLEGVIEIFSHRGKDHFVIKGYTYKLNNGVKKDAEWVTSDQGHRAILIASRISKTISTIFLDKAEFGQQILLFPSTSNPFKMVDSTHTTRFQKVISREISPIISSTDIDELNRLELDRGWDLEGIEVNTRWPLAMHQLRRSLSVYAHRSGMVSLPALKAQLQHITDEMRAYYSDGWSRATNLVFNKDHFSHEWNAAKTESTYFGLLEAIDVAFHEGGELFGVGAQRINKIISERGRKDTFALIKNGTISYRETALGGCVSNEICTAMPMDPINFQCIESNCVNLVVRSKRLDFVIYSQKSAVAKLALEGTDTVEFRLENEHLKRMLLARKRFQFENAAKEEKR